MALRNVRIKGDEILRKKCREVTKIDDRIKTILDDMLDTMYEADGVGLAAPQIGILKRLVVMDVGEGGVHKMINPRIIKTSGTQRIEEGCLSVPDIRGIVERPFKLTAVYTDENGKEVTVRAEDLMAICISHELDHLDGVLFTDKIEKE